MSYDDQYAKVGALFGSEPETSLVQFAGRMKSGSVVLDVGAGQGRNSRFLAEKGFEVHALEPSLVASETLNRLVGDRSLNLTVLCATFEKHDPPPGAYAGVLVFGLIPDLEWPAIRALVGRIEHWTAEDGLVWVTGFTTADPAYARHRSDWSEVEVNTFRSPEGRVRTYLEPGQVLNLFEPYRVLHHREFLGPEHRHGDGPPERHGMFEAVFCRRR